MSQDSIVTRIIFDDTQAIKSMENLAKSSEEVEDNFRRTEKVANKAFAGISNDIDDSNDAIQSFEKNTSDAAKTTDKAAISTKDFAGDIKFLGINLTQGVSTLKNNVRNLRLYVTQSKAAAVGTAGFSKSLRVLKLALISTGIGALIVALGTLATFLTKVQGGMDLVTRATAGLGASMEVLFQRIGFLFEGDFSKAFSDLGKDMVEAGKRASELGLLMKKLDVEIAKANATTSQQRLRVAELKSVYEDTTQAINDRISAATEAFNIEKTNIDENLRLLKLRGAAEIELLTIGGLTDEERVRSSEITREIAEKELESIEKQIEISNALNNLKREGIAIDRVLADVQISSFRIVQDLTAQLDELRNVKLTGVERARADTLAQLTASLLALSSAEFDFRESIKRQIEDGILPKDFEQSATYKETVAAFNALGDEIQNTINFGLDDTLLVLQARGKKLTDTITGFSDVVSALASGIGDVYAAELEQQEKIIDGIREQNDVLEEELDRELELREAGLANRADQAQKALEEGQAREAEAQLVANELRKKELNAQLAADTAQQLSGIAVAAVNFFRKGSEKGPLLGFALATAAIAGMFGILASVKSRSAALQSLHEGGFIGGTGNPWRSDRYGRGHRVEDSNLVLGGDEFVINGRTTGKHRGFLESLNAGYYDNMNLAEQMRSGFRKRDNTIHQREGKRNQQMLNRAMAQAMSVHSNSLIRYMDKQGQYYTYSPGDTVVHVTSNKIEKSRQ